MQLVPRTLRFLATQFLSDPRTSQETARANAAEASARIRGRRHEQAGVDAFLREWSAAQGNPDTNESTRLRDGSGGLRP